MKSPRIKKHRRRYRFQKRIDGKVRNFAFPHYAEALQWARWLSMAYPSVTGRPTKSAKPQKFKAVKVRENIYLTEDFKFRAKKTIWCRAHRTKATYDTVHDTIEAAQEGLVEFLSNLDGEQFAFKAPLDALKMSWGWLEKENRNRFGEKIVDDAGVARESLGYVCRKKTRETGVPHAWARKINREIEGWENNVLHVIQTLAISPGDRYVLLTSDGGRREVICGDIVEINAWGEAIVKEG